MSNSKEIQRRGKEEKKNKRQQPVRGEEATGWGKGRGRSTRRQRAEEGVVDGALARDTRRAVWLVAPDASVAGDGGWMARNDGGGAGGVG